MTTLNISAKHSFGQYGIPLQACPFQKEPISIQVLNNRNKHILPHSPSYERVMEIPGEGAWKWKEHWDDGQEIHVWLLITCVAMS